MLSSTEQAGYVRPGTYTVEELATAGWSFDNVNGESSSPLQSVTVAAGDVRTLTYQNTQGGQVTVTKKPLGFRYDPIYPVGVGVGSLEYAAPFRTDTSVVDEIAGNSSFDTFSP